MSKIRKKDKYIKSILEQDTYISENTNKIIDDFINEKEKKLDKNKKVIKFGIKHISVLTVAASFVLVILVASNTNINISTTNSKNILHVIQSIFTKPEEEEEKKEEKESEKIENTIVNSVNTNKVQNTVNTINNTVKKENNALQVKELTSQEACDLARNKYGITDKNTGIGIEYIYIGITKDKNNVEYYTFEMEWLYPQNEINPYLTTIYVSKDGKTIKDIYNPDKNKEIEIKQEDRVENNGNVEEVEKNEEPKIPDSVPKEKTQHISGLLVTFPNVPINRSYNGDGIQTGSSISGYSETGSHVDIYNSVHCKEYYSFKSLEEITKDVIQERIDEKIIKEEKRNINGHEWVLFYSEIENNVTQIRLYTVKNEDVYFVEAYYSKEDKEQVFKILDSIMIPEG